MERLWRGYNTIKNKNMKRGKLVDGQIILAPPVIVVRGVTHYPPSDLYAERGWKKIVESRDMDSPYCDYTSEIEETDDQILIRKTAALKDGDALERERKFQIRRRIRDRYDQDDEIGLARQQLTKPEKFEAYSAYVDECITVVDAEIANNRER